MHFLKKRISDSRLKKLYSILNEELLSIRDLLLQEKIAAYQESNKDHILDFIIKNSSNI